MNSIIILTSDNELENYSNVTKVYTKEDKFNNKYYYIEHGNNEVEEVDAWKIKQFIIQ